VASKHLTLFEIYQHYGVTTLRLFCISKTYRYRSVK